MKRDPAGPIRGWTARQASDAIDLLQTLMDVVFDIHSHAIADEAITQLHEPPGDASDVADGPPDDVVPAKHDR